MLNAYRVKEHASKDFFKKRGSVSAITLADTNVVYQASVGDQIAKNNISVAVGANSVTAKFDLFNDNTYR